MDLCRLHLILGQTEILEMLGIAHAGTASHVAKATRLLIEAQSLFIVFLQPRPPPLVRDAQHNAVVAAP